MIFLLIYKISMFLLWFYDAQASEEPNLETLLLLFFI